MEAWGTGAVRHGQAARPLNTNGGEVFLRDFLFFAGAAATERLCEKSPDSFRPRWRVVLFVDPGVQLILHIGIETQSDDWTDAGARPSSPFPRCRWRAVSLTPFHSLRVGNTGGRLV